MSEHYDSLNTKTKMVDLSLKYTDGDMEKAKAMASGQYDDVIAIKGKFFFPTLLCSGMFIIFVNTIKEYVSSIVSVVSSKPMIYEKVRIFDDWKVLYGDLNNFSKGGDLLDSGELLEYLHDSIFKGNVFKMVRDNNLDELTKKISEIIKICFDSKDLQCQIDLSKCSSLSMEMAGINVQLMSGQEPSQVQEKKETVVETQEDRRIKEIESEAKYIVSGAIIVSPVSGKYINDVEIGELINVLLIGKDPVTRKLITVLNAERDDGTIGPVKGRLKGKVPLEKSGYLLYALVAKGVLAKIVEEENVKIQMETAAKQEAVKRQADTKLILTLVALLGLIILGVIMLVQFL